MLSTVLLHELFLSICVPMDRGVAVLFLDTEYAKTCDRSTEEDCARGSKEAPRWEKDKS